MKPIKPKKMPKRLEAWLRDFAAQPQDECVVESKTARAILAALEYERQRVEGLAESRANALRSLRRLLAGFPHALATEEEANAVEDARATLTKETK